MNFHRRGGPRVGAGRPKKKDAGVSHARRPALSGREPVHVTLRVLDHVYNLRTRRCFEIVFAAFVACCCQDGFRVVGLSLQGHHLHLLVEAANAQALSRGIQGLSIRLAKGLNRLMGRRGQVFERHHVHPLKTPREVRAAMAYIAGNTAKHAAQVGRPVSPGHRDPYTVGTFGALVLRPEGTAGMVAEPETWLLRYGWQRAAAPAAPKGEPRARLDRRVSRLSPTGVLALFPPGLEETSPPPGVRAETRHRVRSSPVPRAA